jgi:Prohead core protein serine protease
MSTEIAPNKLDLFKGSATVLEFDKPNRNRRIYPLALAGKFLSQYDSCQKRGFVGMLDNPNVAMVLFSQASHVVTKLWVNGKELLCEYETLDTPCGKVLRNLLKDHPEMVAFRPMGVGSGQVNQDGFLVIGDSYKLIAINAVAAHEAS